MSEADLQRQICRKLRKLGVSCHVYHGSVFGETGHPDLYGTLPPGQAYYLEVKPEGWKPNTKKQRDYHNVQKIWMERESRYGAITGVVHSVEEAVDILGLKFNTDDVS